MNRNESGPWMRSIKSEVNSGILGMFIVNPKTGAGLHVVRLRSGTPAPAGDDPPAGRAQAPDADAGVAADLRQAAQGGAGRPRMAGRIHHGLHDVSTGGPPPERPKVVRTLR